MKQLERAQLSTTARQWMKETECPLRLAVSTRIAVKTCRRAAFVFICLGSQRIWPVPNLVSAAKSVGVSVLVPTCASMRHSKDDPSQSAFQKQRRSGCEKSYVLLLVLCPSPGLSPRITYPLSTWLPVSVHYGRSRYYDQDVCRARCSPYRYLQC